MGPAGVGRARSSAACARSSGWPRVVALVPDLLFGSKVQAMLRAAGHEVELRRRGRAGTGVAGRSPALLVVDLTDERVDGSTLIGVCARAGELDAVRTLAFYSHVDVDSATRAGRAGFDLVVPRSRMAREGAAVVERALA